MSVLFFIWAPTTEGFETESLIHSKNFPQGSLVSLLVPCQAMLGPRATLAPGPNPKEPQTEGDRAKHEGLPSASGVKAR